MLESNCPEFFVTHIGKTERIAGNCVRLYCCVQENDYLVPVYRSVWPIANVLAREQLVALIGRAAFGEATTH